MWGTVKNTRTTVRFLRYFKVTNYLVLFIFTGILGPQEVKQISPWAWGWVEGKLGWDMTGFWFSPLGGNGACRITNTKAAFSLPDSRIILGELSPIDRKPYPHLWVEQRGRVIDQVCPPDSPACNKRREFAVVNPSTMQTEKQIPVSDKDMKRIHWGIGYLRGFRSALGL